MRRAKLIIAIVATVVVLLVIIVGSGIVWSVYGDRRLPLAATMVDIMPGSGTREIAEQLQRGGVVSSATALSLYLRLTGTTAKVQAAEYMFPAHQTVQEVAAILAEGGRAAAVWITIPEGFTARQIAQRLSASGLVDAQSFMQEAEHTNLLIDGYFTHGLEGYLFPDTYLVPRNTSAAMVAALMTKQFFRELPPRHQLLARQLHYTIPQIVTIASMVEREAKVDDERAIMAGIYYNRLRLGMPLEVDATIEYALPKYKHALSFEDLDVISPYNTYKHLGLPPTPIANPGRKSLLAAFHPAHTDYLYYVYRGNGRHQFSRTLDEQQQAERKYLH